MKSGSFTWDPIKSLGPRSIESVTLKAGIMSQLLEDMFLFLEPGRKSMYATCGRPYRRGYPFHGQPGTGKSSTILAAAGQTSLDTYVLHLGSRKLDDDHMNKLFCDLPDRCICPIEDIDGANLQRSDLQAPINDEFTTEREKSGSAGVTLSGLLNCIDGVWAKEDRILFMTTIGGRDY